MIAFTLTSLSFNPPLSTPRRLYLCLEAGNGTSQNTEPFMYSPKNNMVDLMETLEFFVKNPQKESSFKLEMMEFDERPQKWFKIAKETFSLNKLNTNNELISLSLPTTYGSIATVGASIELAEDIRESMLEEDMAELLNESVISDDASSVDGARKKTSKRRRLMKLLKLDKVDMFRTASMYYEIVYALTPFVEAKQKVIDFFTWKDPQTTYIYSIILTLVLIYGRYLLAIGLIMFSIFGNKAIPFLMKPRPRADRVQGKLRIYKKNFGFVTQLVKDIVFTYDLYRRAADDPNKVVFLQILHFTKILAPFVAITLCIFKLRILIIAAYWGFLFFNTTKGRRLSIDLFLKAYGILKRFNMIPVPVQASLQKLVEQQTAIQQIEAKEAVIKDLTKQAALKEAALQEATQKGMLLEPSPKDSLLKSPMSAASTQPTLASLSELNTPQNKADRKLAEKTIVIFENQRWWVGAGWKPDLIPGERPSWSDESGNEMYKDRVRLPGPGWHWENNWGYVVGAKTDHEGWEYASRFSKFDDPNRQKSLFHYVRRRKWTRKCAGFDDQ